MFQKIDVPAINLSERAVSRTLLQFRNSPVFLDVLVALISEVQVFIDTAIDIYSKRMPEAAANAELDILGDIVGQDRKLIDYDQITWFTPDNDITAPDLAPAWVNTAPTSTNFVANDAFYRQLIEAKITRNFAVYCSVPELKRFIKQAFGIEVGATTVDIMTLQIIVPDNTSQNTINLLESYFNTNNTEHAYFLPIAACVGVADVITVSEYNLESS